jgi:hypothetical protein
MDKKTIASIADFMASAYWDVVNYGDANDNDIFYAKVLLRVTPEVRWRSIIESCNFSGHEPMTYAVEKIATKLVKESHPDLTAELYV